MKGCCELAAYFGVVCKDCNKPKRKPAVKNLCGKTRPKENPYEVWVGGGWTWRVLKKWQGDDHKPAARWFCFVTSPFCPEGELGDVYVKDIVNVARKVIP